MRKTKIICTMGPAVDQDDVLLQLMQRGMDVARLNFSHGSHEEHLSRVRRIKKLREQLNLPIAMLLDTKGPEIRTGNFANNRIQLEENAQITVAASQELGSETFIPVSYADIHKDLKTATAS